MGWQSLGSYSHTESEIHASYSTLCICKPQCRGEVSSVLPLLEELPSQYLPRLSLPKLSLVLLVEGGDGSSGNIHRETLGDKVCLLLLISCYLPQPMWPTLFIRPR